MPKNIADVLAKQKGTITSQDISALGVSRTMLGRYVSAGLLERVGRGLYTSVDVLPDEIFALSKATEAVGNWWLEDCDVYVTLEPCSMCAGAMINSRIRALYFGAYDEKAGACGSKINLFEKDLFNHNVLVSGGHSQEKCSALLSSFFKQKRKQL